MQDQRHYCQPIKSHDEVLGVLNLYVAPGHKQTKAEIAFLGAIGDTLAGIIGRAQVESTHERLASIIETTPDFVCVSRDLGRTCYFNAGARTMLGLVPVKNAEEDELTNYCPAWAARRLITEAFPTAIKTGVWRGESAMLGPRGEEIPLELVVQSHSNSADGKTYRSTGGHDIRDRKTAELAMQIAAAREKHLANALIDSLPGIFYMVNAEGQLIRWNANLATATHYDDAGLAKTLISSLIAPEDQERMDHAFEHALTGESASLEFELIACDGTTTPYFINVSPVHLNDIEGIAVAGMGIDISYRKQLEEHLRELATVDSQTGALNRRCIGEQLEYELQAAHRYATPLTLVMFDIDHFKQINDRHGHDIGDQVLKQVVEAARSSLRGLDLLGRWGGEEFVILARQTDLMGGKTLAEKVRESIQAVNISGMEQVTARFGVAVLSRDETPRQLAKRPVSAVL